MEWISVKDEMPKGIAGIFLVRTQNGNEIKAYYYEDAMAWIACYRQKTSHWWEAACPHDRIDNVTHWMELPKPAKIAMGRHDFPITNISTEYPEENEKRNVERINTSSKEMD